MIDMLAAGALEPTVTLWWHKWATLIVLALMLYALIRSLVPPDVVFMGGLVMVVALRIISPADAFHGLSNPGLVTVGALFIVAAGLRHTGALHMVVSRLLGLNTSLRAALARLMAPAALMSGFINNTPIVAMLLPEIVGWCRKRSVAASKMLIPLSYATILGGMCTLIGTSTNIVISGMMTEADMSPLSLFELAWVGGPAAVCGLAFVLLIGVHLLPDRKELMDQLGESQREYIVELIVRAGCPLIGQSIQDAGLRQLHGLFLIEIDRDDSVVSPVKPTEILQEGDRLVFTGMVRTIVDLQRIPGLAPAEESHYDITAPQRRSRRLCEAVVSSSFPELSKTIRNSDFRTRYDAVVVAVHRHGARLRKKIGDIVLRPGDTLLLQVGEHFERTFRGSTDFYLVSEVRDSNAVRHERSWVALGVLGVLIVLLMWQGMPAAVAALVASGLMVALRCVPIGSARGAVDWSVLVVIAAALGFGKAIEKSGLANDLADFIVEAGKTVGGPVGVLIGVYLLTNVLTELVSHIGAAAIVFPVALAVADALGVDARPFAVTIAIAASASFATPIGYQTNLMVYGPGGYRFADFLRIGLPMNLLVMIVAILIVPRIWPF